MKHPLLTLFLTLPALSYSLLMNAQDGPAKEQRFRAGLTFGAVASDIPGMDTRDKDSDFEKLGFSVGGVVNTRLNPKNVLQVEINYIQKGAQQNPDSLNMGYHRLALNYIEVPLIVRHTIRMNVRRKPVDRLEVHYGASFGRLIGYNWNEDGYPAPIDLSRLNSNDISLLGGLSFLFTPNIAFNLRYSNSVNQALIGDAIPAYLIRYAWNNGHNQVFLMSVSYIFGGKKKKAGDDGTKAPAPAANE
jgi:hypothetical protein